VRAATSVHEEAADAALKKTLALLADAGHPVTDATRQAIATTIRALPGDEAPGRLTHVLAAGRLRDAGRPVGGARQLGKAAKTAAKTAAKPSPAKPAAMTTHPSSAKSKADAKALTRAREAAAAAAKRGAGRRAGRPARGIRSGPHHSRCRASRAGHR
jgi:hypothetical protein